VYTLNLRIKKAATSEKTMGYGFNLFEKIWFYSKLTLAGGILGYAIREYINRIRPLFEITVIDGGTSKRSDLVTIPQEICDRLESSFFIGELKQGSNMGASYDCWDNCDDLKRLQKAWVSGLHS